MDSTVPYTETLSPCNAIVQVDGGSLPLAMGAGRWQSDMSSRTSWSEIPNQCMILVCKVLARSTACQEMEQSGNLSNLEP